MHHASVQVACDVQCCRTATLHADKQPQPQEPGGGDADADTSDLGDHIGSAGTPSRLRG